MSFLKRLFKSGSSDKGSGDVDARLERLEREAEKALPGYVGTAYNRAGDVALRAGREEAALGYYGRAIDAFLEDLQREAARGVANKIIRVRPSALRTLCTLTWLDLAARHEATALLHLRDYVDGARERDEQARAATQIWEMARISPFEEFVGAVADALDALDYPNRAREVRWWAANGAPDAIEDANRMSDACLQAAVRSNRAGSELLSDEGVELPEEAEALEPASTADDDDEEDEDDEGVAAREAETDVDEGVIDDAAGTPVEASSTDEAETSSETETSDRGGTSDEAPTSVEAASVAADSAGDGDPKDSAAGPSGGKRKKKRKKKRRG